MSADPSDRHDAAAEDLAHVLAEVEVDRVVLGILRSLRSDPTADGLRSHLLGHVLSGRETATALLLFGREAAEARSAFDAIGRRLDGIESALAGIAPGRASQPPAVAEDPGPAPGRPPGPAPDLFDSGERAVPPPPGAGPRRGGAALAIRDIVDGGIRAGRTPVSGALVPDPDPAGAGSPDERTHREGARGANHVLNGKAVSRKNCFSIEIRSHAAGLAGRLGRPITAEEVAEKVAPGTRERIAGYSDRYVWTILRRAFIRIGHDRFWPADVALPDGLAAMGVAMEASLPASPPDAADMAAGLVEAYNARVAPDDRLEIVGGPRRGRRGIT